MESSETFKIFSAYACDYLERKVIPKFINDNGKVAPKLDDLTEDGDQYAHLFAYWHELTSSQMPPNEIEKRSQV